MNLRIDDRMILSASSAIWTLNPLSGALNGEHLSRCHPASVDLMNSSHVCPATLTNQDGREFKPSLAYDPAQNVLSFTASSDIPATEYPVVRAFSFLLFCRLWLTIAPKVHLPFRLSAFSLLAFFGCDSCEHYFLGPLRQCLLTLPRYELRTSSETLFFTLTSRTDGVVSSDRLFFGYADFRRFDVFYAGLFLFHSITYSI